MTGIVAKMMVAHPEMDKNEVMKQLNKISILMVMSFLQSCLKYAVAIIHTKIKKNYTYHIKMKIFEHITKLSGSYFTDKQTGDLIKILESDVYAIENAGIDLAVDIFFNLVTSLCAIALLWTINSRLLIIVLFMEGGIVFVQNFLIKKMYQKVEALRKISGKSMGFTEEYISNILNLIIAKADKIFMRNFSSIERMSINQSLAYKRYAEGGKQFNQFMNACIISVIYLISGMYIIQEKMTYGTMVAFLQYVYLIINPFLLIINSYSQIQNMLVSIHKVCEVLEIQPLAEGKEILNAAKLTVEFEHVDFGYRDNELILQDLCMTFEPDKITALIGESGSGKSTICKLLYRLWQVHNGEIKINHIALANYNIVDLRKSIVIVTQDVVLLNDTLKNNIDMNQDHSLEQIWNICEIVQLKDFIYKLPNGLDEQIGENGNKLSGGQKQRIALARTLLENSSIIVLDEATSALDNVTQEILMKEIEPILRKKTAIVITHRLSSVKCADYIYVFGDQGVAEQGTPDYLSEHGVRYQQLQNK
ncbi:MAG: ABC transporter ATP-binding protein/permease [Eubacterium sp.]|nr:ABC transporter ATP-binding protein/permease [Eubacterium sp.]